jgi:catalase (peroxidase I)
MAKATILITSLLLGLGLIGVIWSSRHSFADKDFNAQATGPHNLTVGEYAAIQRAVVAAAPPSSNVNGQIDYYGGIVRLAFHDGGTYNVTDNSNGVNGCLNPNDPGNSGLQNVINMIEPIYQRYKDLCSRADFWVIAAFAIVKAAGGPDMPFQQGRIDCVPPTTKPIGLLPNPQTGWQPVFDAFVTRMGFTVRDTVALIGAHTLGRCKPQNTGYKFAWDGTPTQFDNQFYLDLLNGGWNRMLNPENGTSQWNTFPMPSPPLSPFVMLDTDMALRYTDPGLGECLNTTSQAICQNNAATLTFVNQYASDQSVWHADFSTAYVRLTSLGAANLRPLAANGAAHVSASLILVLLCAIFSFLV